MTLTSPSLQSPVDTAASAQCALHLQRNQKAVVCGFSDDCFAHKYLCMGVLPGSHVELVRKAAGQTCYFKIDGRTMAVRKEEAACLLIHRLAAQL